MSFEKYIHQLFNVTMTALPIMWFAVFDYQYERQPAMDDDVFRHHCDRDDGFDKGKYYFLVHPWLYRIGIEGRCFSTTIYLKWVAYSLWHACVIFFLVYYALSEYATMASSGKEMGMWLAGTATYGSCVFVVNALLAMKFNIHQNIGVALLVLSVLSYIIFFWIFSEKVNDEIGHLYGPTIGNMLVWLTWLLSAGQVVVFEFAFSRFNNYLQPF